MRASGSLVSTIRNSLPSTSKLRNLHLRHASTSLRMPAMSPTMTEGGIAGWKLKEGDGFVTGDVLLEIETDKATIDVEAQEDGVMGKILVKEGESKIPVGQIIAILAEEGDDLGAIEVPKDLGPEGSGATAKEETKQAEPKRDTEAKPQKEETQTQTQGQGGSGGKGGQGKKQEEGPSGVTQQEAGHRHKVVKHSKPLFPSVSRLLLESDLTSAQISKLKGTGRGGMLTKGDVLVAMGRIKSVYGSAEKLNLDVMGASGHRKSEAQTTGSKGDAKGEKEASKPLDGPALRRLILAGMAKASAPVEPVVRHEPTPLPLSYDSTFDSIIAPYASLLPAPQPAVTLPSPEALAEMESRGVSTRKDEWAGLF